MRLVIGHSAISVMWVPLWIAEDAGLFRRHGLDADIRNAGNGPISVAALASGDIQVAFTAGPSVVNGILAGTNVAIFAGHMDRMPYELVARSDIRTIQDLRGQTIAVNRIGGATGFVVSYVLEREGLNPDRDVSLLQIGGQSERVAALRSGTIAATIVNPPFQTMARQAGLHVLLDTATLPVAYSHAVWAAPRPYLEQNPQAIRAVLLAVAEALRLFKQDQALATRVMSERLHLDDPELLAATWEYWRNAFSEELEPRGLEIILKEALEEQPAHAGVSVDDLVDLRYVRELRDQTRIR